MGVTMDIRNRKEDFKGKLAWALWALIYCFVAVGSVIGIWSIFKSV